MVPYWSVRGIQLGPVDTNTGILLGAIGILVAHFLLLRRARSKALDAETAGTMSLVMVFAGLLGAYWFRGVYVIAAMRDWRTLLGLQVGAASFGGIAGGLAAGRLYLRLRRIRSKEAMRYLDTLAYVFPCGWVFGRLGCSLVHDHPGLRTNSIFGVRYPDGTRFDLGFLEMLFFAAVLIPAFALLDRRERPTGFWLGLLLAIYGAFRLWLDTLHVDPPRFGPLSVDQWAYGAVLLLGLVLLAKVYKS
jgi:phosphatidylglycerol:prolipoprotein diacylglycerol transferase